MRVNELREKINTFVRETDDEELKGQVIDLLTVFEECSDEHILTDDEYRRYKRFLIDNELVECEECGEIKLGDNTYNTYDGNCVCYNCYDAHGWGMCDHCGYAVYPNDFATVDNGNEYWCPDCIGNYATWCDGCESYTSDNTYTIYTSADRSTSVEWCQECCDSGDAYCCDECGQYYTYDCGSYDEDSDRWYCDECSGGHCATIHNYSYKPTPQFRKDTDEQNIDNNDLCFFGVETEVDGQCGVNRSRAVTDLHEILQDFFYYKNDGSLNYGFECVSHPATIKYWLSCEETIKRAFTSLVNNNFRSHQTDTCGYHIHASRKYLGRTSEEQNKVINKILLILEGFRPQIERFSRRKDYHWSQFLSDNAVGNNYIADKNDIKNTKVIDKARKDVTGRYAVLNLNNTATIELRVLRGTLNIETFFAGLELFKTIIDLAKTRTEKQLNGLKWGKLINYNKDFYHLRAYNKRRGIDNEAVLTITTTPKTLVVGDKVRIIDNGNLSSAETKLLHTNAIGTIHDTYRKEYVVKFTQAEIRRINKWCRQNCVSTFDIPNGNSKYYITIDARKIQRIVKKKEERGEQ